MSRISLLLAALSLLPACAAEVVSTTEQKSDKQPYLAESRRCDPNFCILFTAEDTDHDGVADVDEIAAGTDPNDPTKYPTLIDLARLMAKHELPTWEVGNSLMVLLPTRDANGLPLYGGEASLPARKSGLETAGIKAPAGIDLSRGFTMSRTAGSNEMSFGQLFTAFGRQEKGAVPVRLLADAIGWNANASWDIKSDGGAFHGSTNEKDHVSGSWTSGGSNSFTVTSPDGSFRQTVEIRVNADGSRSSSTTTTLTTKTHETSGGGMFAWYKKTTTTSEWSADGRHGVTTSQTTHVRTDPDGSVHEDRESPHTQVCDNGTCETIPNIEPSDPGDYPEPEPKEDDPVDPGDDEICGGGGCNGDDDTAYAYVDPEAADHSGVVTTNLDGMRTAIAKLGSTILVVQNDNDPLSNYEVPPTGIHDAYGPIALYGGDPDNTMMLVGGFGLTPAFVRVPQPEYDPRMNEQKPPMDAPPDGTCLYCYQPPAYQ